MNQFLVSRYPELVFQVLRTILFISDIVNYHCLYMNIWENG